MVRQSVFSFKLKRTEAAIPQLSICGVGEIV